jgi:hypothetical protein
LLQAFEARLHFSFVLGLALTYSSFEFTTGHTLQEPLSMHIMGHIRTLLLPNVVVTAGMLITQQQIEHHDPAYR